MTPQSTSYLDKARRLLAEAEIVLAQGLNEAAGRTAYLVAYHVAQAMIFEDRAATAKTHHGVQTEFQRLTKNDPRVDTELRKFLSQSYSLKGIADYETGPDAAISSERATSAVAAARRFIEHFAAILSATPKA